MPIDNSGAPILYAQPATAAELAAAKAAMDAAVLNASQNTGAGPDAQYDQRAAVAATSAYQSTLASYNLNTKPTPSTTTAVQETTTTTTTTSSSTTFSSGTVYATPITQNTTTTTTTATPAIKTATPQYVLFNDDEVPVDTMVDLLFENIGGQELLTIARADTVNGQKILYQPFKNLNILKEQYNPNNIIRLQATSDTFFNNFSIKLSDKIPNVGNGYYYSGITKVYDGTNVYLDDNGNLVVEFINLANDEQAEIEITASGIIEEIGI